MDTTGNSLDLQALGARIREIAEELELSGTDFALKAGVPYSTYRAYTSGQRAPSSEFLSNVFKTFGVMPSWLLSGLGPRMLDGGTVEKDAVGESFVVIPAHAVAASAGPGAVNGEHVDVDGLCFSRRWLAKRGLNPANCEVINVVGDSMLGKLSHGDKVLVDTSDNVPKSGRAYVLLQGDELLVKYCQLLPEGLLRVSSENPSYPTYDIDLTKNDRVSIVGRVRASTHEW